MSLPSRPIAFVLASSNHGTMILNRHDHAVQGNMRFGVGIQILEGGSFDPSEVAFVLALLHLRRRYFGDGVFAIDGGANIGVHTVEWARQMHGWGKVLSFEAQEIVFYALAGNIAINNCLNARARLSALGETVGTIVIPQPDYLAPGSFGSLELRQSETTQHIGQDISYAADAGVEVPMVSVDSLALERVDLLKLDVEGMEMDVLRGAADTIRRCRPALVVEFIKSDLEEIRGFLRELGYSTAFAMAPNVFAFHDDDPTREHVSERDHQLFVSG
jgi:FkbM family methyltransferase